MAISINNEIDSLHVTKFGEKYLTQEAHSLIKFAEGSLIESGGFGYLNSRGEVDETKPLEAWINCRMVQVFGLAYLFGLSTRKDLVQHGVNSLLDLFEDKQFGGFYNSVGRDGTPVSGDKLAYDQMFVLLAASTARQVGVERAEELFNKVDEVIDKKYWDAEHKMMHNSWDRKLENLDGYHGINSNMHAIEALCAAFEVTGDEKYRARAFAIGKRAVDDFARNSDWLLPEHFDSKWNIDKDFNIDQPADPFRPYGVTIGHLFEWARLVLQLKLIAPSGMNIDWIDTGAKHLYDVARKYGWRADGSDGFIYTMDWKKKPVVTARMHWVAAEAVMSAYTAWFFTRDNTYLKDYDLWWRYIDDHVLDKEFGSWKHELDAKHNVVTATWPGKPDVYHAFNACLLGMYPMKTSFVGTAIQLGD